MLPSERNKLTTDILKRLRQKGAPESKSISLLPDQEEQSELPEGQDQLEEGTNTEGPGTSVQASIMPEMPQAGGDLQKQLRRKKKAGLIP